MKYRLIPTGKFSRLEDFLADHSLIIWRTTNKFEIGDVLYIYSSAPVCQVTYQMVVNRINLPKSEYIDDSQFYINKEYYLRDEIKQTNFVEFNLIHKLADSSTLSMDAMKANGLKGVIRSNRTISGKLFLYVQKCVKVFLTKSDVTFEADPKFIKDIDGLYEGSVMQIMVNKYERNHEAREICLNN